MIACTHHAAFHVWTLGVAKAFATLRLIMITIYKLQAKRKPELEKKLHQRKHPNNGHQGNHSNPHFRNAIA